jgi:tetratricopeptide (TPR) repeat protein
VLSALDREITIERAELKKARDEAIKRLEEFVARYSGPTAHPEHTPDAMFRLAALYEERAQNEVPEAEQAQYYKPAIALYKRVIREFPKYDNMAAIYYYLGHSLNNSGRSPEAQQVWRSLVCHNKFAYPVPVDPSDAEKDTLVKKPQDHEEKYWDAWAQMHPEPIGQSAAKQKGKPKPKAPVAKVDPKKKNDPKAAGKAGELEPQSSDEETSYRPIYSEECAAIPQKVEPGGRLRFVAEVWWSIGDFHFEQQDVRGGPYNYNRAVTAYRLSMKNAYDRIKDPVYGVSQYKLAWTYYKQQRYEAAVKEFIALLKFVDEKEAKTGDPGTDFRGEAYSYIAGSLAYVDFTGPAEEEPFIIRSDVLDTELREGVAEQKMHIGLERALDPKIIPQGTQLPNGKIENPKWTIEILKALAREYKEVNQYANTTDTLEAILQKYPLHRDAPLVQDELAATYEERSRFIASKSPQQAELFATKALQARTNLANYVGNTPWVDANKDDPEAIQAAERLAKGGLRNAAVAHTQKAIQFAQQGNQSTVASEQRMMFEKSLAEYKLAETAWEGYYRQDETAQDAYETRWWIADSRYWQVQLMVSLDKAVPGDLLARARSANADVRDSNEDDRFLEPAANHVTMLARAMLTLQYKLWASSQETQGFPELTAVRRTGSDKELKIDATPPPNQVLYMVQALDEYAARVPANLDPAKNGPLFQFQAAKFFFYYGQFDEAKKRYEAIFKECKKTPYSYQAYQDLRAMATFKADQTGDQDELRALIDRKDPDPATCAADQAEVEKDKVTADSIRKGGLFIDAWKAFQAAQAMQDGPERVAAWRKAGDLYDAALTIAPDRNEAPEAAMNGAFAFKQIGDYDKAIAMYRLFINKYGDDKTLSKLEKGDDKDRAEYQKRRGNLRDAYDALASAYVLFFNYKAAAETYDTIASIKRFDESKRKEAARNALSLYASMGDRDKMNAARNTFLTFKPSAEDKAEADYIVASADLKQWDPTGADTDANKTARGKATASLSSFYDAHKRDSAGAKYATEAAYWIAKMKVAGGANADDWWKSTMASFKQYKGVNAKEAVGSRQGNMAAEAEFTIIDEEIRKNFDYDTGHHKYKGTMVDVVKKYQADAKDAEKYNARLKELVDANTYGSIEYVTAALARQGSLYDSLRTGLFNTREPALQLFNASEEKLLKQLEESGNQDLMDKAAERRDKRNQDWRQIRDKELTSADNIAVRDYSTSVAIARKFNVRSAAVNKALQRLAFFTDVLGDEKMRQYSNGIENFTYSDGMFQKSRPGMVVEPDVPSLPAPLPVVVK